MRKLNKMELAALSNCRKTLLKQLGIPRIYYTDNGNGQKSSFCK